MWIVFFLLGVLLMVMLGTGHFFVAVFIGWVIWYLLRRMTTSA